MEIWEENNLSWDYSRTKIGAFLLGIGSIVHLLDLGVFWGGNSEVFLRQ